MKILIAYDGSESADTGIDGLARAGLPGEGTEALVVSVGEVWLPPAENPDGLDDTFPFKIPRGLKWAREHATHVIEATEEFANRGTRRVQRNFPRWSVSHAVAYGSPAFELLHHARHWLPQLIVVGSHGHTALGRFVLGSVSQKVLTEAQTSVRVARQATGSGVSAERIVLGVDGSPGSNTAARAVAARGWSTGSEVRVVVVQDLMKTFPVSLLMNDVNNDEHTQAEEIAAEAVKELRAGLDHKGITVSLAVETGDPKQVLVRHAKEFGADCIFTGATGTSSRVERFLLGSVSAAVAARAHCSVEVVRAAAVSPG